MGYQILVGRYNVVVLKDNKNCCVGETWAQTLLLLQSRVLVNILLNFSEHHFIMPLSLLSKSSLNKLFQPKLYF